MPHDAETAPLLLKEARRRAGLTQAALGARAGVRQPVIAAYEGGRRQPTVPTLRKLLRAAGFDLDAGLRRLRRRPDDVELGRQLVQVLDLADAISRGRSGLLGPPKA